MSVEEDINHIEAEYAAHERYLTDLAPAKPFLVPSFDNEVVEILPSKKANQKIRWEEKILVQEIENRYADMEYDDEGGDDEDAYEIEIVGDEDGDADFYLEIVDGEVFYVFETEDDISDGESEEEDDEVDDDSTMLGGDESTACQSELISDSESDDLPDGGAPAPTRIPASMAVPNLDEDSVRLTPESEKKSPVAIEPDERATVEPRRARMSLDEDESSEVFNFKPRLKSKGASPSQAGAEKEEKTDVPAAQIEQDSMLQESAMLDSEPCSPVPGQSDTAQILMVDMVPCSPVAGTEAPLSPGCSVRTPRSILKACPDSPRRPPTPKKVKDKTKPKEKKEKTFTKTYVRAEQYDGEHVAYSWEKPSWTNTQLRSTDKGEQVRKGGNLASPITFPKKAPANASLLEEEEQADVEYEKVDKEELIRRLRGGYRGKQRKLKFSINGAKIREGGDIVQPITKATVYRKPENINAIANQQVLKSTALGSAVKEGKDLAAPVTAATIHNSEENQINKIANPLVLKSTALGSAVKEGKDLAAPVTLATVNKAYEWEKPDWAKRLRSKSEHGENKPDSEGTALSTMLTSTALGNAVKEGKDLAAPVTSATSNKAHQWEKPAWAKRLNKDKTADGEQSACNGTEPPKVFISPTKQRKKNFTWEKPSWTKPQLSQTGKSDKIKVGENLANPITFPPGKGDGVNRVVQPDEVLKPTENGDIVKQGDTLSLPITQLPDLVKQEDRQPKQ